MRHLHKTVFLFTILFSCLLLSSSAAFAKQSFFENVRYMVGSDSQYHTLDIYGPAERPKALMPVVIYVHGGGWQTGDKKNMALANSPYFTDKAVLIVSVNYRLSPDVQHPAHIEDLAKAVSWIKNNIHNYSGDASNMVLVGHSSGAQMVALLGTNERFLAKYDLPLNMFKGIIPVDTASFDLVNPYNGKMGKIIEKMRKNAFGTDVKVLEDASPYHQIKSGVNLSPFFIFATGARPEAVKQGQLLAEKLNHNGHQANSTEMDSSLNHRDMNIAIFKEGTEISNHILALLGR